MHLHLDPLGGIAGDMFIAALIDAWPELADETFAAIRAAGLPGICQVSVAEYSDGAFRGKRFQVIEPAAAKPAHRGFSALARELGQASLDPPVRERAVAIFELLARAEADVHGVGLDEVVFHELGGWDSIADVVAAAHLLEALRPDAWSAGPLPRGRGRIRSAHGYLPVPTPATVWLLRGFDTIDDGLDGERVTPTGAAILRHLAAELGMPASSQLCPLSVGRSGNGFGTRTLPGVSNLLRVIAFDDQGQGRRDDAVGVISFEVDDQTPEDLAAGLEALRGREDILDVLQAPAIGKKGRMVAQVQVLCRRESLSAAIDACFAETTTIGLRWAVAARARLRRQEHRVDAGGHPVSVKVVTRPDGTTTAKAAAGDVAGSGGHASRQRRRQDAEKAALAQHARDEPCKRP